MQSLENFFSIAIKGTEVPIYTNTLFLYFSNFSIFFLLLTEKQPNNNIKLDEMLNLQKSASNCTSLMYDFSSPSIATSSTTIFVPPANNVETENNDVKNELASENIDKDKTILGAPTKLDKKEIKNPRAKKGNSQKPKHKK